MRIPLIAAILLSSVLTAQTTVTLITTAPIAVLTSEAGGATTFAGIPQNQPIGTSPNSVALTTSQSPAGKYLSAMTNIYPTMAYQGGIGFNFFERAYARGLAGDFSGTSDSGQQTGATLGAHVVLATFAAAPGTAGNIKVHWRNSIPTGGAARAIVDVDNDGTPEVDQAAAGQFSIPYTFGASGQVVVRVSNECTVTGVGLGTFNYTWTEMWVGFLPDLTANCTITSYGQGCSGVLATGGQQIVGTSRHIDVQATGCFASSPVIVATGSQRISLPLPGGCALLSNAEGVTLVSADGAGTATVSWQIPVTAVGTTYMQMLPVTLLNGALALAASNGVEVDCYR